MTNKRFKLPVFATEAEQADWVFANQDVVLDEFKAAAEDGRLQRGAAMRRAQQSALSSATTIQIEAADEAKARAVAAKRGMEYEEFLEQLLHKELQKPEDVLEAASAA